MSANYTGLVETKFYTCLHDLSSLKDLSIEFKEYLHDKRDGLRSDCADDPFALD